MQSNKNINDLNRFQKLRKSRVSSVRKQILREGLSGLLNNQKWYRIFSFVESRNYNFAVKSLNSENFKESKFIRELYESSVLVDELGGFIEFLEIDKLKVLANQEFETFLINLNVEYLINEKQIEIIGYR